MKKKVLFAALALLAGLTVEAQNYNLTAVAPTGQTLYFYGDQGGFRVVHPGNVTSATTHAWGSYALPTGALVIPDSVSNGYGNYPVIGISDYAFMNCDGLTSVVIPNTVKGIRSSAFYDCDSLVSVTLPDTMTSGIGDWAFGRCFNLAGNIVIPYGVETIGEFAFCYTKITSLTLPPSCHEIGGCAFYNCTELTGTVTIPSSVTLIGGGAFYRCYKTLSINLPTNVVLQDYSYGWMDYPANTTFLFVKNINHTGSLIDSNNTYGVGAWGARTLNGYIENNVVYRNQSKRTITACDYEHTSVTLPTSVDTIGFGAFLWHQVLTQVVMPNGLVMIGDNAFNSCIGLTQIDIPSTVNTIGSYAFSYCSGLSDVTLPAALTTLGLGAFSDCDLDTLRMLGSVPPMYETNEGWWSEIDPTTGDTLWVYDTSLVDVPILVPCNAGRAYRHAAGWSACNNIIDPCGDDEETFTVTVSSADPTMGSATVNGAASITVEDGETVALTASANEGYRFVRWNDNDTNVTRTVTVTSDIAYIAYFESNGGTDGIGSVDGTDAKVIVVNGQIVVDGAEGNIVTLYDAAGRQMAVCHNEYGNIRFDIPAAGTYLVKVGDAPARRVVVVR